MQFIRNKNSSEKEEYPTKLITVEEVEEEICKRIRSPFEFSDEQRRCLYHLIEKDQHVLATLPTGKLFLLKTLLYLGNLMTISDAVH